MNLKKTSLLYGIGLILFIIFPLFTDSQYFLHIGVLILYSALISQAWNILSGYAGQFSFGHAMFFGTGAYISATLFMKYDISPWIGMFAGAFVAILIGLFIGYLSFRYKLRGAYFSLGTLAFAEILRILVQNLDYFNKTLGFNLPIGNDPLMFQFSSRVSYYYIILIMLIIVTLITFWISRSRLGFSLIAIRENEDAAQSLGVNTFRAKMTAIAISGALTALGGAFYAQYILYIAPPTTFGNDVSVAIILPAILGGMGTILGPIIGALIIIPLGELTAHYFGGFAGVHLMVYGLILVLVILFLPEGIVGWVQEKLRKRKLKKEGKVDDAT
ncbi:branched-chain amino acid ABC transporter permease [Solibacillus sp. FSL W7-1464]|uniref:branched-chain amino acid ABC transporter permease n=1 Tax=Solibacillus sp. FSL W7-1464 TaxID=2921706 RepID=UPI0030F6216D